MSDQLVNDIATIWANGYGREDQHEDDGRCHVQQSGQPSTSSGGHSVSTAGRDLPDGRWHAQW